MSLKEIKDAIKEKNVLFGIRQTIKFFLDKKKSKNAKVYVSNDIRDESIAKLEKAEIEFEVLKSKEIMSKELNLDFESEIFLIR